MNVIIFKLCALNILYDSVTAQEEEGGRVEMYTP